MRLILENTKCLKVTYLPKLIDGNYWIVNNNKNLLNVEAKNNKWIINSNEEVKISKTLSNIQLSNINHIDEIILETNHYYYVIDLLTKENYILYVLPDYEYMENFIIDYNRTKQVIIGNKDNDIIINNELFGNQQLSIEINEANNVLLKNLNAKNKLFVNNKVCNDCYLTSGDIIFVAGIYIYFFGSLILISNDKKDLTFNSLKVNKRSINKNQEIDYSNNIDKDIKLFDKSMYFQRPPRFKRIIENKEFKIDPPTQKENEGELPFIFTLMPMLTMGMMSFFRGFTSLQRIIDGESSLKKEFSSLLMCGCMLLSILVFPLIQKFYTKMKKKQKEKKRRRKYKKYVDKKREEIFAEINYQRQVLIEDNLPIDKVMDIILTKSRNLWERKIEHPDFLELRLGIGNKKPEIDINYPEEHFTLEEDDLKDIITDLVNESKDLENVPITLNFRENNKVGVIGNKDIIKQFLDNLMLQILAYHGYDMLRIIILTNDSNKSYWEKYRNLTHLWNNDKSARYFATNKEDVNKLTSYLREEYNYRLEILKDNKEVGNFIPYYLIITDDVNSVKNNIFIKDILELNNNIGYSLLMCVDKLDTLPNECSMFINVAEGSSGLFSNEMTDNNQISFIPDLVNFPLRRIINNVSNIPIDINSGKFVLPRKYSFLEMYDVGNVKQLNLLNRWKNNDIINSLAAPVGIDEQGELFIIDLHEKAHGPHGLVAGMTGSGKSEWIITYILSMAVNYSPEEVQFVLIDYKGGGLALTFDNRETGIKLPHVVGTLTNLDVVEMKRSLASINSELKRRQTEFKKAREKLNESSMDIYKYQEYYRMGQLTEPMSHLFIISDEFAELKSQQPEFMAELISAARIGRSLGIHLILATQKPNGVVNDQIWSNSKFKVCLKVQDRSDSNDMIKRPDAAMIKETGRFYLLVGYSEFFALGQSAYAGMPYYESEKKVVAVDSTIDFVDDLGIYIKRGDINKNNTSMVHKGEELPNILKYIIDTSNTQRLKVTPLWLNRVPDVIYVDKLKEKYNWVKEDFILNPIIGEYDLPSKQYQGLLTLPISQEGNTLVYGNTGSGKENFITTLLYSLMNYYEVYEVNAYILDFGSGILNNLDGLPHIGDVIKSGDEEKIENLFKFLESEVKDRKNKFLSYNGNYYDYVKNVNEKIPNILIIINQYEVFSELYDKYVDRLINLTRDCIKYGIYFLFTSLSTNSVRLKLSQNFKNIITLQLNDDTVYRQLFGKTDGILPSKTFGRGLTKLEKVVEFQTAFADIQDTLYDNIKIKILEKYKDSIRAKSIPVLPETIGINDIVIKDINVDFVPFGIKKDSLEIATFDLKDSLSYLISSTSFNNLYNFIDKLLYITNLSTSLKTFVVDMKYIYEENKFKNINYMNSDYNEIFNKLFDYYTNVFEVLKNNKFKKQSIANSHESLIIIIGLDKFFKSLSAETKTKYEELIKIGKECNKIHFIFIDILNELKKCEYDAIYKNAVDSSNGLWIGNGFSEQTTIKASKYKLSHNTIIDISFGFYVRNGQTYLTKLIENTDEKL